MTRIAIIGAGMAGLTLAQRLQPMADISVFEKSRGYGGRMATRTRGDYRFDHGAQYFTCRSPEFEAFLQPYIDQGVVARWDARFVELEREHISRQTSWSAEHPHYVAVPGMNALGKSMATGLEVVLETRVCRIEQIASGWQLQGEQDNDLGTYDWVVTGIPAAQATQLLPIEFCHHDVIASRQMLGCYSLMLGFTHGLSLNWDAALVRGADISWISVDHSKPGRDERSTLLVHSTNEWAEARMELDRQSITEHLLDETSAILGLDSRQADHIELHSWRYANIASQQGARSLVDTQNRVAAVGDWCIKGRVEAAFLSALDAADRLRPLL